MKFTPAINSTRRHKQKSNLSLPRLAKNSQPQTDSTPTDVVDAGAPKSRSIIYGRTVLINDLRDLSETFLGLDQDHIKVLAAEIASGQTLAPVAVAASIGADGREAFRVLDGYHRIAAAKIAERSEIVADVYNGLDLAEMARKAMSLNLFRLNARPLGILLAVKHFAADVPVVDIARQLQVEPSYIWQAQKVIRYCPEAMFKLFVAQPKVFTWRMVRDIAKRIAQRSDPVNDKNAAAVLRETMAAIADDAATAASEKAISNELAKHTMLADSISAAHDASAIAVDEVSVPKNAPVNPNPVKTDQPRLFEAWSKLLGKSGVDSAAVTIIVTHLAKLPSVSAEAGVTRRDLEIAMRVLFRD